MQISLRDESEVVQKELPEVLDMDIESIRARRMTELRSQHALQNTLRGLGHGEYSEISEADFLSSVIKSEYCVVHFYHDEFVRCKSVDKNLSLLALPLLGIRFLKIDAQKCPFFVEKLLVKILPTILFFKNGKTVHRIVGFEQLGGNHDFTLKAFVTCLNEYGMLKMCAENDYAEFLPSKKCV